MVSESNRLPMAQAQSGTCPILYCKKPIYNCGDSESLSSAALPDYSRLVWDELSNTLTRDKSVRRSVSPSRIQQFQKKSAYANILANAKLIAQRAIEISPEECARIEREQKQTLARLGLPSDPEVKSKKGRPVSKRLKGAEEGAKKSKRAKR